MVYSVFNTMSADGGGATVTTRKRVDRLRGLRLSPSFFPWARAVARPADASWLQLPYAADVVACGNSV